MVPDGREHSARLEVQTLSRAVTDTLLGGRTCFGWQNTASGDCSARPGIASAALAPRTRYFHSYRVCRLDSGRGFRPHECFPQSIRQYFFRASTDAADDSCGGAAMCRLPPVSADGAREPG